MAIIIKIEIAEIDNGFFVSIDSSDKGINKFYVENLHQTANEIDKYFQMFISYYLKFKKVPK